MLRRSHRRKIFAFGFIVLTIINTLILPEASAATPDQVAAFRRVWARTDTLVDDGAVNQSWVWGPKALDYQYIDKYRYTSTDAYFQRAFRHYDKGRMEIDTRQPAGNKWYIRSGALVKEMVTGKVQVGEQQEFAAPGVIAGAYPAQIPVVGDPVLSDSTPTYATFTDYATLNNNNRRPDQRGQSVVKLINRYADTVAYDSGDPNAKIDTYEDATGHNVPVAFSRYMKSSGTVQDANGNTVKDQLFDPIWHFGYPITEAYWARVKVGGKTKTVMFQLFERRVLTYTPDNPAGWQVEMGNVGLHYLRWRTTHDLTFSGPPRISPEKFKQVLASYGSPVTAEANDLYNVIGSFNLDPGVALAFFVVESGAGTAVGYCDGVNSLENKNWGNARGDRSGACGFQKFPTWRAGLEYWCKIMSRDYVGRGLDRLQNAINVYAPPSDGNDVNNYYLNVYRLMLRWQGLS